MDKGKILSIILSVILTVTACETKNTSMNEDDATATAQSFVVPSDNPQFESRFTPILSKTLPRIDIQSIDNELDFVTLPYDSLWDYTACKVFVTDDGNPALDSVPAGVKVRGNWTARYDKKSLRIRFDERQSLLGLHQNEKYRDWVLLACYKDWSMLRDASSFYMAHLMGDEYVSDFRLVKVYVNTQYWGVYLLCEQQQTGPGRVDITKPEAGYEGTDIGYFLEYDGYYDQEPVLKQFTIDYGTLLINNSVPFNRFQNGFTIKSDIYSETQNTFIKRYMQNVFRIVYEAIYNEAYYEFDSTCTAIIRSETLSNSYETIDKVIDMDSWVNAYILAELSCDPDLAWSSFYMDVDFGENGDKKLHFEAPWDFDSAYGNIGPQRYALGLYAANVILDATKKQSMNPWYALPMRAAWFKRLVRDKFNAMVENKTFDRVYEYIDTISTSFESDFAANDERWDYVGHPKKVWHDYKGSDAGRCKTQKEAADYLKRWLANRVSNLSVIFNTFH